MQDLIVKYFNGQLSPEEKEALFTRLQADEAWQKEFSTMQNLRGLTSWLPVATDEADAVGKLLSFKQARRHEQQRTSFFRRQWMGYAAAILISVVSTWSAFYFTMKDSPGGKQIEQIAYEEFSTPAGQRALVKLHDGTTVWLNARTTLRYPNRFSPAERKVELDGEAFFDVAKNESAPFIVSTEKLSVKVTGTQFNVFAYRGQKDFTTSLTEGSVLVYTPGDESKGMVLTPNEYVALEDNRLVKKTFSNTDFLLWKEGIYAFDDVPFREIVKKLELYYDITIIVQNTTIGNYRINAKFRQRDGIESVLKTLNNMQDFTYEKDDEKNIIIIK
jgi:transmembrane sensor